MPHLLSDADNFIPGGLGGLDDGDRVALPWVRQVTETEFSGAPLVGWYSDDLYLRRCSEVRMVSGEPITRGRGFFFCPHPRRVFLAQPLEKRSHTDPDPVSLADQGWGA